VELITNRALDAGVSRGRAHGPIASSAPRARCVFGWRVRTRTASGANARAATLSGRRRFPHCLPRKVRRFNISAECGGHPPPLKWSAGLAGPGHDGGDPADRCERGDLLSLASRVWRAEDRARLKELELENSRLRKAVSDLTLDKLILQEASRGNSAAPQSRLVLRLRRGPHPRWTL
jgi:putative transposase